MHTEVVSEIWGVATDTYAFRKKSGFKKRGGRDVEANTTACQKNGLVEPDFETRNCCSIAWQAVRLSIWHIICG